MEKLMNTEKQYREISSRVPIPGKRSQEYVQWPDGSITRLCYAPHNPHYYQDEKGEMHAIEIEASKTSETSEGKPNQIWSRNIASVGRITDGSNQKWLGIRPDVNQKLNTESLEFDLVSVEFDGKQQRLSSSDLSIINSRQRCRQLVPAHSGISSFRIEMLIHSKGLRIVRKDKLDEWWLYSKDTGEFRFRIRRPVITDAAGSVIRITGADGEFIADPADFLSHTLTDNEDGTYTYIKESLPGFENLELPESYFIDADTYYAETSDGFVVSNDATWSGARNATAGDSLYDAIASYNWAVETTNSFRCIRSFFNFDLSGVELINSADLYIYGVGRNSSDVAVQGGTQGENLSLGDFDALTGNYFDYISSWSMTGYNQFSLNSEGISFLQGASLGKLVLRNYTYDYLDSSPPFGLSAGLYFSDNTGTANDPYLSITETIVIPTVTTSACSNIGTVSVQGNGSITATGGANATERGFCYIQGTSGDPTTSNSKVSDTGSFAAGSFAKIISGLSPGTSYRVRAYAINSAGTAYGVTVDATTASANLGGMFFAKPF